MSDYILNWSDGIGRVSAGSYLYDVTEKPEVGFDFDALYFETPTNMNMKIIGGEQFVLTEEEQQKCKAYCDAFYQSDDFKVLAIEPELKIFKGFMKRGECRTAGYEEVNPELGLSIPNWSVAKLVNNEWKRVVACITEEGRLVLLPGGDNPKYNFFFTEEEWAEQPKPEFASDLFDFKDKVWKDARKFNDSMNRATSIVRNMASREYDEFNIAYNIVDPVLYIYQVLEADKYVQNKESSTPFVDASVAAVGEPTTKEEFVNRILGKYDPEYLTKLGAIHGKMIKVLDQLSQCETVADIDTIMEPILANQTGYNKWKIPAVVDPYASDAAYVR